MNCRDHVASFSCSLVSSHGREQSLHERLQLLLRERARLAQHGATHAAAVVAVFVDEPGEVHRAPGVPNEDERLAGRDRVVLDHQTEVVEVTGQRVAAGVVALGQSGAALVPEHDAETVVGQRAQRQEVAIVPARPAM
jgi:hypothetical protein